MELNETEKEILSFLSSNNVEIRLEALKIIRSLSAGENGDQFFIKNNYFGAKSLTKFIMNNQNDSISIGLALDCLINSTCNSNNLVNYLTNEENFMKYLSLISDTEKDSSKKFMLLSNLTRNFSGCESFISATSNFGEILRKLCNNLNIDDEIADYRLFIIRNCSQLRTIRDILIETDNNEKSSLISKLFPLTNLSFPVRRRRAVVDILRNCCFDTDNHRILTSFGEDFICSLISPLAGPEELDDDENDKLPVDLQYLTEDKVREPEADIRITLLEALYQLGATTEGREFMRNSGVYYILREYHKWETDLSADELCSNVVNVLIRTEGEIGCDNLHKLNIPEKEKSV